MQSTNACAQRSEGRGCLKIRTRASGQAKRRSDVHAAAKPRAHGHVWVRCLMEQSSMHARDLYLEDQNHQGTHREHLSQVPAIRVPRLCVARPPDPCVYTVGGLPSVCVCVCF